MNLYATIAFHLVSQLSELSARRFQTLCDLETDPRTVRTLNQWSISVPSIASSKLSDLHVPLRRLHEALAFVDRGVAHSFHGGKRGYEKHHLGTVVSALAVQDCVQADGIDEFDFIGVEYGDSN